MKTRYIWMGLLALLPLALGGCGQQKSTTSHNKQSQSSRVASGARTTSKRASSIKADTPKPSELTTLLQPLMARNAEDQSSQTNGSEMTYSQFTYHQGNWHWQLTGEKQGTIVNGTVTGLTSSDSQTGEYKLAVKASGETFTLKLSRFDNYYRVETSYKTIKGLYIIGDTDGHWQTGAPTALTGTWSTEIYKIQPDKYTDAETLKKEPYERTRFFISDQGIDGQKDSFTSKYTVYDTGNGWGANDVTDYKQLGDGRYLLKTNFDGSLFNVYRVTLKNNRLTVDDGHDHLSNLTKVSTKSGMAFGFDHSSARNLTEKQVDDWILRHLTDFARTTHHVKAATFIPGTDDKGRVTVEVRDSGRDSEVSPRVGNFRITKAGVLESEDYDSIWWPVSDDPTN